MTGARWLSLNDVLKQVPLSRNTIYAALIDGSLAAKKVGNKWIISQDAVDEWLTPDTEDPAQRESGGTVESVYEDHNGLTVVSYE